MFSSLIPLAQPNTGIDFNNILPSGEDLKKALGLWITFGILLLILQAWKMDSIPKLIVRILTRIVFMFAVGATVASIPLVGV